MLSWSDEMDNMLGVLNRQVKASLKNIKIALTRDGLSFNAEFKQYFLRSTNKQIEESYDQFEIKSMFEDQINVGTYRNTSEVDTFSMMNSFRNENHVSNGNRQTISDLVEVIDSSDGEDQPENRFKLESSEVASTIRYDDHDIPPELHHDGDDGSYSEMDDSKKVEEIENDIPAIVPNMDTSTITLHIESNIAGTTKNMARRPKKCPRNGTENHLQMKKRFKCQHCEYSSDKNWLLKRHMDTHTGKKPYRCEICRKEFAQLINKKRHKITHTDVIPFHCRGCFDGFSQKVERKAHERVCKSRRYECHICKTFVTVSKSHMKIHLRKHNGEKPFRCKICMKGFTVKYSLKIHLETFHTSINP
ncbi:zinc finger and SCAN domain-containing protein 31-like [Contarinia nasturtii]|uniref:zinc finger and SCAN domain-containing protein 31-like n=1 Tax=Contarinia nasturtii TaxID=265458 RepID=UPI0012D48F85|nr:zinc finger and SCAN domain-containing protein 31-like [Contarinia nasturtii]